MTIVTIGSIGIDEQAAIVRVDDLDLGDPIAVDPRARLQLDAVARLDVLQHPEEAVPMTRDADVAAAVRKPHALDEARAAIQMQLAGADVHGHFDIDRRDAQHGHGLAEIDACARLVLAHAHVRPQRAILRSRVAREARERRSRVRPRPRSARSRTGRRAVAPEQKQARSSDGGRVAAFAEARATGRIAASRARADYERCDPGVNGTLVSSCNLPLPASRSPTEVGSART